MNKFKVGDRVLCVDSDFGCTLAQGQIYTVLDTAFPYHIKVISHGDFYTESRFKLVEYKKTPHVHAALIKAWADGAQIQVKRNTLWVDVRTPLWECDADYRIKPEPKPDVVSYAHVRGEEAWRRPHVISSSSNNWNDGKHEQYTNPVNVKFTFDGETGKLKSVEMI